MTNGIEARDDRVECPFLENVLLPPEEVAASGDALSAQPFLGVGDGVSVSSGSSSNGGGTSSGSGSESVNGDDGGCSDSDGKRTSLSSSAAPVGLSSAIMAGIGLNLVISLTNSNQV